MMVGNVGLTVGSHAGSEDMDVEELGEELMERRNVFVKSAIKAAGGRRLLSTVTAEKVEALSTERRAVVKEFLATITKDRTCGSCGG